MAAKHAVAEAAKPPASTEPPATMEDAARILREGLGPDGIAWERTFRTMIGHDGETIYVDESTGQVYPSIPNLHPADGKPV